MEAGASPEALLLLAAELRGWPPGELALLAQLRAWVRARVLLLNGQLLDPLGAAVSADHLKQWIKTFYPRHNLANTQLKPSLLTIIMGLLNADAAAAALGAKGEALMQRIEQLKAQAEARVQQQRTLAAWQQALGVLGGMPMLPLGMHAAGA